MVLTKKKPVIPEGYLETGIFAPPKEEAPTYIPEIETGIFAPPVAEPPPEPIDLPSTLKRLYPEMFKPEASYGFTREEFPAMVAQTVQTWAMEEPESFLEDLRVRGRNEDSEGLLRLMSEGATRPDGTPYTLEETEEFIEDVFAPPEPLKIPKEGIEFV